MRFTVNNIQNFTVETLHLSCLSLTNWGETMWLVTQPTPLTLLCHRPLWAQSRFCLLLNEAECFNDLWKEIFLPSFNVLHASKMCLYFIASNLICFYFFITCLLPVHSKFCKQTFYTKNGVQIFMILMFKTVLRVPTSPHHAHTAVFFTMLKNLRYKGTDNITLLCMHVYKVSTINNTTTMPMQTAVVGRQARHTNRGSATSYDTWHFKNIKLLFKSYCVGCKITWTTISFPGNIFCKSYWQYRFKK